MMRNLKQNYSVQLLRNQSGQGVTEYILVLVVIVAIVLGGLYQLNTAFEKWANNYFGEYLTCLLETGELPSIGAAPGDSGICNELFEPFSLANGRMLKPATGAEGGGGGNPYQQDPNSRGGGPGSGGGVRDGGSGAGGSYVSRSGAGSGSSGSFGDSSGAQGASRRKINKAKYTGSTESSLPSGAGYSQVNSKSGRPQYVAVSGQRIVDVEERETKESSGGSTVKRTPGSNESERRIRVLKKDLKKVTEVEDEPMTFGSFFRFLIIAAIIIALFLLLGGQALQISKNSE